MNQRIVCNELDLDIGLFFALIVIGVMWSHFGCDLFLSIFPFLPPSLNVATACQATAGSRSSARAALEGERRRRADLTHRIESLRASLLDDKAVVAVNASTQVRLRNRVHMR